VTSTIGTRGVAIAATFLALGCELVIPESQYRGDTPGAALNSTDGSAPTDVSEVESSSPDRDMAEPSPEDDGMDSTIHSDAAGPTDASLDRARDVVARADSAGPDASVGSNKDASTNNKDAARLDAASVDDANLDALPEGATPACHIACDTTFCCGVEDQHCCPSICNTHICHLGPCPSTALDCAQ
jgi:hypothetical protein